MRILFDLNHAAHVHFVRNAHRILSDEGHECMITASNKPLAYKLLDEYKLDYFPMGNIGKSLISKFIRLIIHDIKLLFYCLKHKPDVILGIVAIRGSHVGKLLGIRSIVFTDTEGAPMQIALFKPFATEIHTPNWFEKDLGKKQIRYKGFHEMAYLHPNHFKPRIEVKKLLGVAPDEKFFILRFVAWDATHDLNEYGVSLEYKRKLVELLKPYGKIFISSEYELEEEFKSMEYNIPFSYLHDSLYFASMLISEGTTTACEAAILGTACVCINSNSLGYLNYLESEYELVYHYKDNEKAFNKIKALLESETYEEEWHKKKEVFISTQLDTTAYIKSLILK